MKEFKNLQTVSVSKANEILQPGDETSVDLFSSAMEILTDFSHQRPLMIEQNTLIEDAKALMKKAHVRLKLVIDQDEKFKGVISLADLFSVKVMRAAERTGLKVTELTVADIMTHKDALRAIDIKEFKHARIGDVLSTMKSVGEQHVLVLDSDRGCIRGIISSSDIARRLHAPVFISERAKSFSDIYRAVRA